MSYLCLFSYPMDGSVRAELHGDLHSVTAAREQFAAIRSMIVAMPVSGDSLFIPSYPTGIEILTEQNLTCQTNRERVMEKENQNG